MSHRWQYSDRHFVGDAEQKVRELEGSQVINNVHVVDFGLSYAVTKRVNATLSVPFQFATRSQTIRDNRPGMTNQFGNQKVFDRYSTEANGLSDIKLLASAWLLNPDRNKKQNIAVGLGVLFPTGEKDARDEFEVFDTNSVGFIRSVRQNVDNSIQPGAGAWGIIFDISAFKEIFTNFTVFAAGTYIATPEEDAGVVDRSPLSAGTPQIWSVGDSYLFRAGLAYKFLPKQGLTLTLSGRMEGSPSTDLIGGSGGRRRPGFAVSIEPGLVFAKNGWSASFSAPVALYRNRERNFAGASGDAAFADFMTLFSVGKTF